MVSIKWSSWKLTFGERIHTFTERSLMFVVLTLVSFASVISNLLTKRSIELPGKHKTDQKESSTSDFATAPLTCYLDNPKSFEESCVKYPPAPSPWQITGNSIVCLYKTDLDFVKGCLPEELKDCTVPGFSTLALIRYKSSPVGRYDELLFVPGPLEKDGHRFYTVSHMYVSSMASVNSGRKNWGFPKIQADFQWTDLGNGTESVVVIDTESQDEIFRGTFQKSFGGLKVPLIPSLIPFYPLRNTMFQFLPDGTPALSDPIAKNMRMGFTKSTSMKINAKRFPNVSGAFGKPLVSLETDDTFLYFDHAVILDQE